MARDSSSSSTGTGTAGTVRRPKSSHACTACKRQKTRCEMISSDERLNGRCHRCTNLSLHCSLQISPIRSNEPVPLLRDPLQLIADWAKKEDNEISSLGPALGEDGGPKRLRFIGKLWSFISPDYHQLDWSSLTASLRQVLDRTFPASVPVSIPPVLQPTLSAIIDHSQITRLLDIFEQYYDPWLCFKSSRNENTLLLDLVRCSIASRFLEPSVRRSVAPRINHLAEAQITTLILDPPARPTLQHVEALLIFSLWAPLKESAHRGIRDGRQLLASAASIALSLRLNQVSTYIIEQRKKEQSVSNEMVEKAQVWLSLCNAESMMCLGTGRLPTARRSDGDRKIFASSDTSTLEEGRRCRLQVLASLYDLAERGTCINLTDLDATEQWYKNVDSVLETMAALHETISPMIAVTDNEHYAFHSLKIHYMSCRLHVIYSNIFSLRYAVRHLPTRPLLPQVFAHSNGLELIPQLARTAHKAAESVLEVTIYLLDGSSGNSGASGEPDFIGFSLPDSEYLHISICAAIVVGAKFFLQRSKGLLLPGMSDQLLGKVSEKMGKWSHKGDDYNLPPDHPASKVSTFLTAMMALWEQYLASSSSSDALDPLDPNGNVANFLKEYDGPTLLSRVSGGEEDSTPYVDTPPAPASTNYHPHEHHRINPGTLPPILEPSIFVETPSSSSHFTSSNDPSPQSHHQHTTEHHMNPQHQQTTSSSFDNTSSLPPMNEEDIAFWQYFLSQENTGLASFFHTTSTPSTDSSTVTPSIPSEFPQHYQFSPDSDVNNAMYNSRHPQ